MEMATEALFTRTARLPRIELIRPPNAIGKNTVTAMQSGVIFGYVGLVEGLVGRLTWEMGGKARVIATGGYARPYSQGDEGDRGGGPPSYPARTAADLRPEQDLVLSSRRLPLTVRVVFLA